MDMWLLADNKPPMWVMCDGCCKVQARHDDQLTLLPQKLVLRLPYSSNINHRTIFYYSHCCGYSLEMLLCEVASVATSKGAHAARGGNPVILIRSRNTGWAKLIELNLFSVNLFVQRRS